MAEPQRTHVVLTRQLIEALERWAARRTVAGLAMSRAAAVRQILIDRLTADGTLVG